MILNLFILLLPAAVSLLMLISLYYLSVKKAIIFSGFILASSLVGLLFCYVSKETLIFTPPVIFLNSIGIITFYAIFFRTERKRLNYWIQQRTDFEMRNEDEHSRKKNLKADLEKFEKETVRTLRLYGAVKGLGKALSWNEMIPHIDYAAKQYLGLQDYQLYLLDESSNFQKVISRGTRMIEAPLQSPAQKSRLHRTKDDTYLEGPIFHGNTQIGIFWARLSRLKKQISENDLLSDTDALSEELGMGLQKARLFSSLEKLSRIDGLTGVYRRQIFNERLNEEIRRARVFKTVFSVLIGDLDHFKQINDVYGHQAGDEVLRRTGEILRESIYETDFVARYGGEEFVILFPQADPAGVMKKAELLRNKIAQETFILGLNKINITISLGIAHYSTDGTDGAALLNVADQALYLAKENGRNRVVDSSELHRW